MYNYGNGWYGNAISMYAGCMHSRRSIKWQRNTTKVHVSQVYEQAHLVLESADLNGAQRRPSEAAEAYRRKKNLSVVYLEGSGQVLFQMPARLSEEECNFWSIILGRCISIARAFTECTCRWVKRIGKSYWFSRYRAIFTITFCAKRKVCNLS